MKKLLVKIFNWLDRKALCPCGICYRLVNLFRLMESKNKAVLLFLGLGLTVCGLVIDRLPSEVAKKDTDLRWN